MKNGILFFLGIFAALSLSWLGMGWAASKQLGQLQAQFDPLDTLHYPQRMAGVASRGMAVYKDLGCASCHTQQVRRPGLGYDQVRAWGERASVARDYLYQSNPPLGQMRRGQDLSNYGERAVKAGMDRAKILTLLYTGTAGMPSYTFLFEEIKVEGKALPVALNVPTKAGKQLVPSSRAEELAAYLLSLKQDYSLPEAPVAAAATQEAKK